MMSFLETVRHLFSPHHTNNHRPKILHPTGLSVLIGMVLVTNSAMGLIEASPPEGMVLGFASNITGDAVLAQTNLKRAEIGLPPLKLNDKLNQAALAKANDMFMKDYWAHTSPEGTTPWVFIKGAGYRYSVAGENLARDFGDTPSMVEAWMNSPTHKANIIHPKYVETGIAVVDGKLGGVETTLVVHMFGTPAGVASIRETAPKKPQLASGRETGAVKAASTPQPQTTAESAPIPSQPTEPVAEPAYPNTILAQSQASYGKTYVSPLKLKQSVAMAVAILLIGVLIVDEVIIRRKKLLRFVGHNLAHLGFLTSVVILIVLSGPGGIL